EAVWEALKTEPNVVVVASSMVSTGDQFDAAMQSTDPIQLEETGDDTFEPYTVTARGNAGESVELTVIGVMDTEYSMFFGYYLSAPTMAEIAPDETAMASTYSFKVDDSRDAADVAADMESALLQFGAQGIDVA